MHTHPLSETKSLTHLPTKGLLKIKPTNTPHIHGAHPTPYWLANCPITTHDGAIYNLCTTITKGHGICETTLAKKKFPYVDKWLSSDQINQKISNHF